MTLATISCAANVARSSRPHITVLVRGAWPNTSHTSPGSVTVSTKDINVKSTGSHNARDIDVKDAVLEMIMPLSTGHTKPRTPLCGQPRTSAPSNHNEQAIGPNAPKQPTAIMLASGYLRAASEVMAQSKPRKAPLPMPKRSPIADSASLVDDRDCVNVARAMTKTATTATMVYSGGNRCVQSTVNNAHHIGLNALKRHAFALEVSTTETFQQV
mmetsp:Transcript_37260/g.85991  ORF Transcript_37260/g.85991 Transcript_37260/m.85991 type:complete len:214 (+) Transcript_37260:151-792(+)